MIVLPGSILRNAIFTLLISTSLYSQQISVFPGTDMPEKSGLISYESSWSVGAGVAYPRFVSVNKLSYPGDHNYGFYLSGQRNFTEKVTLRAILNFLHIESHYYYNDIRIESKRQVQRLYMYSSNFSLVHYFEVISPVRPYFAGGLGLILFNTENSPDKGLNDQWFIKYQISMGMGAEWQLDQNLKLKTEIKYHTASSSRLDGEDNPFEEEKGLLGGNTDMYMCMDVGLVYYFSFSKNYITP